MKEDDQIKLYSLLIDQLTKYNTIIWQIPTALFAVNLIVLDKLINNPLAILAIVFFNSSLIFAFYKMIFQQRTIIDSVRKVENLLRLEYNDFIPNFKDSKVRAPVLSVCTLILLNLGLFFYFLYLSLVWLVCRCVC